MPDLDVAYVSGDLVGMRTKLVQAIEAALDAYGRAKMWLEQPGVADEAALDGRAGFIARLEACIPLARLLGCETEVGVLERFQLGVPLARVVSALQRLRHRYTTRVQRHDAELPPQRVRARRPRVAWRRFVREPSK